MTAQRLVIQPSRIIVGIITPFIPFNKADLTDFYSAVNKQFEYGSFALLNPGANIISQDGNQINIVPNRVQLVENVGIPFENTKQKISEVIRNIFFKQFKSKLIQPFVVGYGIKLISQTPCGSESDAAVDFLSKNISIGADQLKLLGDTASLTTGLRFHFLRNSGEYDLRIEPWLQQRNVLWTELDTQFPGGPLDAVLNSLEQRIADIRNYFVKDVAEFLEYWKR